MGLGSFLYRATGNIKDDTAGAIYHGNGNLKDGAGDLWNDFSGKTAARDAAKTQVAAADKATALQREMYDKNVDLNEPWRQAGLGALGQISKGMESGEFNTPEESFSYDMKTPEYKDPGFNFDFKADPGYAFRQQEQQKAIERSAAAGGGLFSGATLSDLALRSGQMASDEYGNAYNRARSGYESDRSFGYGINRDAVGDAMSDRNFAYGNFMDAQSRKRQSMQDRFSRLSTLAGIGEAGTSRVGTAATTFGQQAGDNTLGAGNARAASLVGGYNSQRDTLMGLGNLAVKAGSLVAGGA